MWQHVISALALFRSQKIRFLLTVSGIVVGVGSLVLLASLLSVGEALLQSQSAQASGDDVVTVENDWDKLMNDPKAERLKHSDQLALERSALLETNTVSANYGMLRDAKASFEGTDFTPWVIGVSPTTFEVFNLQIAKGRLFNTDEYVDGRRVAVVGANTADGKLAPGDTIRLEGNTYLIVGVLAEKADMGPGGPWSWNRRVVLPDHTYNIEFNPEKRPNSVVIKVRAPVEFTGLLKDYALATKSVINAILMREKGVESWHLEGVQETDSTEAIIFTTIETLIYLTTVFSMIVGGINIMNIMLVTVAERTREIGLRRALGAKRGDILAQFLAETVAVTLIGAALGMLGAIVLLGISSLALTHWVAPWPFHVEPWSLGLGLAFSSLIGLTFGMYPAWRASRLDPVEALRME